MDDCYAYCSDCKKRTEIVLDHSSGDTICTDCGLVLEDHYIDETCEWRTFADSEKDDYDPKRVGSASNPLLTSLSNLLTTIAKPSTAGSAKTHDILTSNSKAQDLFTNPDKVLTKGFESIATMADRLSIHKNIKIRADEIFKNVVEKKAWKGKNQNSILAACLFIACKEIKLPRTIKEICSVAEGVSKKEISRAVDVIRREIEGVDTAAAGSLNGSGFVRRFCSVLGMKNHEMKAAEEAVENSREVDIRRSPTSILAAIIFVISQLSELKLPLQEIAMATQVAEQTIRKSYKDVYPYASKVIPHWYAKQEDLKKLSKP